MRYFISYTILFLSSCSTSKDNIFNRSFHVLTAKYNILYNGDIAYEKAINEMRIVYRDDFSKTLPIEPFTSYTEDPLDSSRLSEEINDDTNPIVADHFNFDSLSFNGYPSSALEKTNKSINTLTQKINTSIEKLIHFTDLNESIDQKKTGFKLSEKKAVKAIQKHSMLIDGKERNHLIDDAYLLLGKSRYYQKKFTQALEAFEYIIKNYPTTRLMYETIIWKAKTHIHLNDESIAKALLNNLNQHGNLNNKEKQHLRLALAMSYEKTPDSINETIIHLKKSLNIIDEGNMACRAAFILGQLCREKKMISQSNSAFDKVINMKDANHKYKLQAKLEKIKNQLQIDCDTKKMLNKIDHLIASPKNRHHMSKLLFQKGWVYEKMDAVDLAKNFYKQSLKSKGADTLQHLLTYEQLGNLYYREKKYTESKFYYDSLIQISKNKHSKYTLRIKAKSDNLERVSSLEKKLKINDSILELAHLNQRDLKIFFRNYIDKLKRQEERYRERKLAIFNQHDLKSDKPNTWYFDHGKLTNEGREKFKKLWKNQLRNKYWSISSLYDLHPGNEKKKNASDSSMKNKYQVSFYMEQINTSSQFLDSITKIRNLNYYELANIYYHQFSEKKMAVEKLEKILERNPSNDLTAIIYYHLYKIYKETKDEKNANLYAEKLKNDFPKNSFTKYITASKTLNSPKKIDENIAYIKRYEDIYTLYISGLFESALKEISKALVDYQNSPLSPKYALLHAYIMAKLEGELTFHRLLKEMKLKYPNASESIAADHLLTK